MEYNTIVYQTLENSGIIRDVVKDAPYICTRKNAWLSEGYYFWEYDIDYAHLWGKQSYRKNGYIIIKFNLHFDKLLDLVGNPEHRKDFIILCKELKQYYPEIITDRPVLFRIIRLLRDISENDKDIFDYEAVKSQDFPTQDKELFFFSESETNNTNINLSSRMQICLFEMKKHNIQKMDLVFQT